VAVNGAAPVSLVTNDGGNGGALSFGLKGSLSFANVSSALMINATPYTLVGSISAVASAVQSNPSGYYALAADYDAAGDGTYPAAPIETTLTGTVEGLGNTISDLSMNVEGRQAVPGFGLFAEVGSSGTVASLKMSGYSIRVGTHPRQGAYGAGGMVGISLGTLFDDHVAGDLWTKEGGGGLLGQNDAGSITASSSSVNVSGPAGGGGLVWWNFGDVITESYATGAVSGGPKSTVGGLVAINASVITNSYAVGATGGGETALVGGLVGLDTGVGIGWSYSTGRVSGGRGSQVGGFAGQEQSEDVVDCFWDTTTSGTDSGVGGGNIIGITGMTTAQIQSGLPAGLDPTIWTESSKINSGLPYLIANVPK
jgi:hypothetical protein